VSTIDLATLPPELLAATTALAENLACALPIVTYHQAEANLRADREAAALLDRYSQGLAAWREHEARGEATAGEIQSMRKLQSEVRSNPTLAEVARSQQVATAFVREINGQISRLLGLDFAALSRRAGCC
jgi:cell fate (sporulation/competence/biofilm development) regulator YlbF (YheA/YmcA/DUF963 family)